MSTRYQQPVGDSLQRIETFLEELRALLRDAIDHPEDVIPHGLRDKVTAAWGDVEPRFDQALRALPEVADRLADVGLTGAELDLKLEAVKVGRSTFHRVRDAVRQGWRGGRAKVAGLFASTLGLADVPLGSLAKLVPILEPVVEFKGVLERGADLLSVADDEALWTE